jgi:aspartyl-tRNA(Asn)/glutamyl-tRNA(Gln) amidotransferase subunit B
MNKEFQTVIGLEVHCELKTETKLWCNCPNRFGESPNSLICPICLGLPGSLPVLNEEAFRLAIKIGLALNCNINSCIFHRKNYFYPDMPKNYQISQYDMPLNTDGFIILPGGKKVGIIRAHLEEDTGKTIHSGSTGRLDVSKEALVDYNRAGVPLVEIVSAPDIESPQQAREYVEELRLILLSIGASDVKMEEGSLRVDANVSVRQPGEPFGTRCEIKNLNSLRSLVKAIDYEIARQSEILSSGEAVIQETRHFNESDGKTHALRSKEEAHDYRYFPDPDLGFFEPDVELVKTLKESLGELPRQKRTKLTKILGADVLTNVNVNLILEYQLDELILKTIGLGADPKITFNRVVNEVMNLYPNINHLSPERFKEIIDLEVSKKITPNQAKTLISQVSQLGREPKEIIQELNLASLDEQALKDIIKKVIKDNQEVWQRFVKGDEKPLKFLVGQVMKATQGRADGQAVTKILIEQKSIA